MCNFEGRALVIIRLGWYDAQVLGRGARIRVCHPPGRPSSVFFDSLYVVEGGLRHADGHLLLWAQGCRPRRQVMTYI